MSSTEKVDIENQITKLTDINEQLEDIIWKFDIGFIDAIVYYCEQNDVEIETIAKIVKMNSNIKTQIEIEAEQLNYLPKTARLDFGS